MNSRILKPWIYFETGNGAVRRDLEDALAIIVYKENETKWYWKNFSDIEFEQNYKDNFDTLEMAIEDVDSILKNYFYLMNEKLNVMV